MEYLPREIQTSIGQYLPHGRDVGALQTVYRGYQEQKYQYPYGPYVGSLRLTHYQENMLNNIKPVNITPDYENCQIIAAVYSFLSSQTEKTLLYVKYNLENIKSIISSFEIPASNLVVKGIPGSKDQLAGYVSRYSFPPEEYKDYQIVVCGFEDVFDIYKNVDITYFMYKDIPQCVNETVPLRLISLGYSSIDSRYISDSPCKFIHENDRVLVVYQIQIGNAIKCYNSNTLGVDKAPVVWKDIKDYDVIIANCTGIYTQQIGSLLMQFSRTMKTLITINHFPLPNCMLQELAEGNENKYLRPLSACYGRTYKQMYEIRSNINTSFIKEIRSFEVILNPEADVNDTPYFNYLT